MDSRRRFLRLLWVLPLSSLPVLSWFPRKAKAAQTRKPSAFSEQGFYTIQIFQDGSRRYGYRVTVQNFWEFERRNHFDSPELALDEAAKRCMWFWNVNQAI